MSDEGAAGTAGSEKRKLKRWHLIYYLRVFDEQRSAMIGHVFDITTQGLRLVSEWPIPSGSVYQLSMEVPHDSGETIRISLPARALWSRPDEDSPGFHHTGFQLLEPSTRAVERIRTLIEAFKEQS